LASGFGFRLPAPVFGLVMIVLSWLEHDLDGSAAYSFFSPALLEGS
jgi:hypothetical protein